MIEERFIRRAATIRIITEPANDNAKTFEIPELVIDDPFPAERPELEHINFDEGSE